jgi:hypothetical protein
MSRCLRERALWLLSEGEASRADRAHVASCTDCAARLHRLEQDLSQLRLALSGPQPPQAAIARLRPVRQRWLAAAAALAALVLLAWSGVWWQQPPPPLPMEVRQESIWSFIEGVSAALFLTDESGFVAIQDQLSDLDDLQAALVGEWPCEGPEAVANFACDDDTFALLLGEL